MMQFVTPDSNRPRTADAPCVLPLEDRSWLEAGVINLRACLLLLLALFLCATAPPKRPIIVSIGHQEPVEVTAGGNLEYPLGVKILKGFHIQANPASQKFLIPLTVKLNQTEGVQIGSPVYPPGIPFRLKGSDRDISTYEDKAMVKIPLQVDAAAKSGELALKGTLRYQGCDAELCFPPVTIPLELKLRIK